MRRVLAVLLALPCVPGPALAQEPPAVEAQVAAGVRQVQEGDFEGAVVTLEAAAARLRGDPQRARLLVQADVQLGVAEVALDHVPRAMEAFREASSLDAQLRLTTDRFSPKVVRVFESARKQAAGRPAAGSSGRTALLVAGAAATAAGAVLLATHPGGGAKAPSFTGARFGTPVITCPDNSQGLLLPFLVVFEASNPGDAALHITSVSTVVKIEASADSSEVGFSSNQPSTFAPQDLLAHDNATVQVQSTLVCGNGAGDAPRFNEWSGTLTITTTSAGVFTLATADRMRVNIP